MNHTRLYNMYMTLYLMYSRVFKNMLKLRYRVRGRTSQENNRHPPCQILISKIATLLSLAKNPGKRYVHFIQCTFYTLECICIIWYVDMCHKSWYDIWYKIIHQNVHSVSVSFDTSVCIMAFACGKTCGKLVDTCACIICTWQSHRLSP